MFGRRTARTTPARRTHGATTTITPRTTATPRRSLRSRLLGPKTPATRRSTRHTPAATTTTTTTTTTRTTRQHGTAAAVGTGVHHKRHATIGDKVSGAMMRLRGSLTRRPGLKAAGARRMNGTDGRGARVGRRAY